MRIDWIVASVRQQLCMLARRIHYFKKYVGLRVKEF